MEHSFDIEIATKYGINCAILLKNIYYWTEKNRVNDKHFYDGYYWTYNSVTAFQKLFPYLSNRKIEKALSNLKENGFIITGNYNKSSYDRTMWYAVTEKGKSIILKCEMVEPKKLNGNAQKGEPIPNINTNLKSNERTNNTSSEFSEEENEHCPLDFISKVSSTTGTDFYADKNITATEFWERIKKNKAVYYGNMELAYIFDRLYEYYPKHQAKKEAALAFFKFVKTDTKENVISLTINLDTYKKKCQDEGREERYIKNMQGFINDVQFNEYAQYNCDVRIGEHYYKTKDEYVQGIITGEIEMYLLPRACITL